MITEGQVLDIAKDAIYYIIICSAPVLIISLVVGLIISIFQTVTSIQEQTPAKLSCIIQVILRLPVMHTAAKHIDLLLHSTGICCIHLHRHPKHKRRNDHSGTDQHNMMFLLGPFSEMLMHLQSHLPELPSLVGRTLSWWNGSLPSAPQW